MAASELGDAKTLLLAALALFAVGYSAFLVYGMRRARRAAKVAGSPANPVAPTPGGVATGFVTNFFDTLGIGSYAPTTAIFRFWRLVPDEQIPGTMNVGHTLP